MDKHRFVGSDLRSPSCVQRFSNTRSDRPLTIHVLAEDGTRTSDRSNESVRIADAMIDTMFEMIAKQNNVSMNDAKVICSSCALQLFTVLFERILTQAHLTTDEAQSYIDTEIYLLNDLGMKIEKRAVYNILKNSDLASILSMMGLRL